MLEFLVTELPKDIRTLIYIFDGRITRAYLREHISSVYSRVYQTYFGRCHNLKYICGSSDPRFDRMGSLPYYSAWATIIGKKYPQFLKVRKTRKYMRSYHGLIKDNVLKSCRLRLENNVCTNYETRLDLSRYTLASN